MLNTLFGIKINDKIEEKLLKKINECHCFIHFENMNDIEIYVASNFIYDCGFEEKTKLIIQICWESLKQNTSNSQSLIFSLFKKCLHKFIFDNLVVNLYQNDAYNEFRTKLKKLKWSNVQATLTFKDYQYQFNGINKKSNEDVDLSVYELEAASNLKNLDYFIDEAIHREILIESSFRYSIDELKKYLRNTFNILNKFEQFKNQEKGLYEKVLINFEINISNDSKLRNFIKKIKKSKIDCLGMDKEEGVFFVHIVNIIYSVFNISEVLNENNKVVMNLKEIINDLEAGESMNLISNLLYNLSKFKNQVNKDQLLQYVTLYFYQKYFCEDIKFEDFKDIIAFLFDRNKYELFKNTMSIEKINKPFDFMLFNKWIIQSRRNKYYLPVKNISFQEEYSDVLSDFYKMGLIQPIAKN